MAVGSVGGCCLSWFRGGVGGWKETCRAEEALEGVVREGGDFGDGLSYWA